MNRVRTEVMDTVAERAPTRYRQREWGAMSLDDHFHHRSRRSGRGWIDAIIRECSVQGHSRQDAEDAIDSLRAVGGRISEHKFGWFRLTEV